MEDLTLVNKTWEGLAGEMLKIGRENKELKEKLDFVKGLSIHWGGLGQSDACFTLDTKYEHGFISHEAHGEEYERLWEIKLDNCCGEEAVKEENNDLLDKTINWVENGKGRIK